MGVASLLLAATPAAIARKPQTRVADAAGIGATTGFTGSITRATGRFKGDHGRVTIDLSDAPPTTSVRSATLTLTPLPCRDRTGCLKLAGRLTGTLTAVARQHPTPDLPPRFAVNAAGKVKPIGHAHSTGVVQGTGFVFFGRETLQLELTASGGRVTIDARSALVPGFTTP